MLKERHAEIIQPEKMISEDTASSTTLHDRIEAITKYSDGVSESADFSPEEASRVMQSRIDQFNSTLDRDVEGKLLVPHYLSPSLVLSNDGKSVAGLKGFSENNNSRGASRSMSDLEYVLKKEYDEVIQMQTRSMLDKFSPSEIVNQLKSGNDDFSSEDVKAVLAGRIEKASSPVSAAYVRAALDAVISSLRSERSYNTAERDEANDLIPEIISLMQETQANNLVFQIESKIAESIVYENETKLRQMSGLNTRDKMVDFVREQLAENGYLKGSIKTEEGHTETNTDYITRLLSIKIISPIKIEYDTGMPRLDENGVEKRDADGNILTKTDTFMLVTKASTVLKSVLSTIGQDIVLGWRRPASDKVGENRNKYSRNIYDQVQEMLGEVYPHRARQNHQEELDNIRRKISDS